jgi:hypothetical protein
VDEALATGGDYEVVGFPVDKDFGGYQLDRSRQYRSGRNRRTLTGEV